MKTLPASNDPIQALKDDYRRQLETFFAGLRLAPPYDSVEKAIKMLVTSISAMTVEEQTQVLSNTEMTWSYYRQAFIDSGLYLKHRGIILGLIRDKRTSALPLNHVVFLNAYGAGD